MTAADRMPPLQRERLTEAQIEAERRMTAGPRGGLRGPFIPLLRSPELLNRVQHLGEYLRYDSAIPGDMREFAILIAAAWWRQGYEWQVHRPLAEKAGIAPQILEAVARGERPDNMTSEQAAVHDFAYALHRTHAVDDATYAAALALLGEGGVVDLCGVCGYYALLAMGLNVARTPSPDPDSDPFA